MKLCGFVYILANRRNGTLYVGVTRDIAARLGEHRSDKDKESFVSRYGVYTLVWYERHNMLVDAIAREKAIKRWKRAWKIALIEEHNPKWQNIELDYSDTE
ncbi:MAG: GIY-YIG nuclease family protein [Litorimonas sp.]